MKTLLRTPRLEQIAFLILMVGLATWTFSNELVHERWKRFVFAFYRPVGPPAPTPRFTADDAAAEFVAAWTARGLPGVLPDSETVQLTESPIRYRTGQLQSLYKPPRPEMITADRTKWIEVAARSEPVNLMFEFPGGRDFSNIPQITVIGEPAEALVGQPAILFWSTPAAPGHISSRGPSMAADFEQRGALAVAVFPIARLVDFWKEPTVARLRLDVPARSNARIFITGLTRISHKLRSERHKAPEGAGFSEVRRATEY